MAFPIVPIAALAAAAVGYKFFTRSRFVGDLAKPGPIGKGDQVEVTLPDLMRANTSISVGNSPGQIPPGTNTVLVAVLGANKNMIQGPITTIGTVPLAVPLGSVVVPRQDVKAVYRVVNGKTKIARDTRGNFAGDRHQRFAG